MLTGGDECNRRETGRSVNSSTSNTTGTRRWSNMVTNRLENSYYI